jgi:hypothetical protein
LLDKISSHILYNMSTLPNSQENSEKILNDIQSLQQMEQQLFNNLESQLGLSPEQQKEIVENINNLSKMRINLYQTLGGVNEFFHGALTSSVNTLKEQTSAIAIVENELNRAKKRLEIFEAEKNNKIRLVQINEYYGDKYSEHAKLMKILIFTLVPILLLTFINSKGFLPNMIYYILFGIIAIIGSVYFWTCFASIMMRDKMNYQEYDWYFDPKSAPTGSTGNSIDPWSNKEKTNVCIGQSCCSSDQKFDTNLNKCIDTPCNKGSKPTNGKNGDDKMYQFFTESMVSNVLSKTQHDKYKSDVDLTPNYAYAFQP